MARPTPSSPQPRAELDRADRLAGALLGTAVGDALGLVAEGMSGAAITKRFGRLETFRLWPGLGIVSDDTEQAALVAQALVRAPDDATAAAKAFRRSLVGWFWRLPWGIGLATLRACLRATCGLAESGVASAGNGASMRAPIVGVFFADDVDRRRAFGTAFARITHTDPRGVQAALFAAEVAARLANASCPLRLLDRASLVRDAARAVVTEPSLGEAIEAGIVLGTTDASTAAASAALGNTGFVVHTLPLASFCFVRFGDDAFAPIVAAVAAGGDTDTTAAIVGAWSGAHFGWRALPAELVQRLAPGPFGEAHLRALARDLAIRSAATDVPPAEAARFAWPLALLRNLALFPLVLVQALRTVVPI